ncbi:hypothetical protein C9374_012930 [Naegleria lovaniensis]|uniref:Uncharacterized protein n=1 Tax=Naegleria lovaniensis TaxID=51637 RepID=A0AA88GC89_NAELO|nr:uncharacterized protein C9374_012930 [Naegleria lovaniensis]KAG2372987.1 hypothetical protein C9374_012930 [Naegleria lovaniensis]
MTVTTEHERFSKADTNDTCQTPSFMVHPLTNPIPIVRLLLQHVYIHLFQMFLPPNVTYPTMNELKVHNHNKINQILTLSKCELILQRTLMFVHYFHSSHLNRWLHFLTIIPFFSGVFLVLGVLLNGLYHGILVENFIWIFPTMEMRQHVIMTLDWTLPLVLLWSLFFIVFAMGIDRYAWLVLASFCVTIASICCYVLSVTTATSDTSIMDGNGTSMMMIFSERIFFYDSSSWLNILGYGFSLWFFGFISQAFVAHVVVDRQIPAFLVQEALLITPIYIIMTCSMMYNPCLNYLPKLRKEIEQHATRENFQKFGKIQ